MLIDDLTLLAFTARLLVLLAHPHPLDEYEASLWKCGDHLTRLSFLVTREDSYGVASFYMQSVHSDMLYNLGCTRDNGLVPELLELARNWAEDASCLWLLLVFGIGVEDDDRVLVKADV